MPGRIRLLLFTIILTWVVFAACRSRSELPRIEWTALPESIIEKAEDLKTGYLVVPERRFPEKGHRAIRLPFIIMKSRSSAPRLDPVLTTAGGPGGSTLARARSRQRNPLLEERDVILFEQRGTRFAKPALLAPKIDASLRSGWGTRLNGEPDPEQVARAMAETLHEYEEQGIDLAGYTTKESASDICDLRRLLGIDSWNLYGYSYSTKLMLTILRDNPEGVRAVVLDSILPLEANWDEEAPANILDTLQQVLTSALEDEVLGKRIDGLEERLFIFLAQANLQPVEIECKNPLAAGENLTLRLDAAGVMNCIYAGLEDSSVIPRLPLVIDEISRGDIQRLAPLAEAYLASFLGYAWGMRTAVWCNEEFPFERPARITETDSFPCELSRFVQTAVPLEALRFWPQGRPEPSENEPVRSDVPVLIASGEFDPDTPTKWAQAAASFLRNSQVVEFAGMSHVPLFSHPDADRIIREFLDHPRDKVDPGRAAMRLPFVITLKGK
jgi:pimeloyl-ACP methyl ester carboxylesterase